MADVMKAKTPNRVRKKLRSNLIWPAILKLNDHRATDVEMQALHWFVLRRIEQGAAPWMVASAMYRAYAYRSVTGNHHVNGQLTFVIWQTTLNRLALPLPPCY